MKYQVGDLVLNKHSKCLAIIKETNNRDMLGNTCYVLFILRTDSRFLKVGSKERLYVSYIDLHFDKIG